MSELKKWAVVSGDFETVREALEYLEECGAIDCQHNVKLKLHEFFDINPAQLERERRELLESLSAQ
jgi:hypothetical protein